MIHGNFFKPNHLHPLQVENFDSNSRLVLDKDDNGNFRLERVKQFMLFDFRTVLDVYLILADI